MAKKMPTKVFLAATRKDLARHRKRVIEEVQKAGFFIDPSEFWGATSSAPVERCPEEVLDCHICILIVAFRRGDFPPGEDQSYTQKEYLAAKNGGIPVLAFLAESPEDWPDEFVETTRDPGVLAWREQLEDNNVCGYFHSDPLSLDIGPALMRTIIDFPTPGDSQKETNQKLVTYLCPNPQCNKQTVQQDNFICEHCHLDTRRKCPSPLCHETELPPWKVHCPGCGINVIKWRVARKQLHRGRVLKDDGDLAGAHKALTEGQKEAVVGTSIFQEINIRLGQFAAELHDFHNHLSEARYQLVHGSDYDFEAAWHSAEEIYSRSPELKDLWKEYKNRPRIAPKSPWLKWSISGLVAMGLIYAGIWVIPPVVVEYQKDQLEQTNEKIERILMQEAGNGSSAGIALQELYGLPRMNHTSGLGLLADQNLALQEPNSAWTKNQLLETLHNNLRMVKGIALERDLPVTIGGLWTNPLQSQLQESANRLLTQLLPTPQAGRIRMERSLAPEESLIPLSQRETSQWPSSVAIIVRAEISPLMDAGTDSDARLYPSLEWHLSPESHTHLVFPFPPDRLDGIKVTFSLVTRVPEGFEAIAQGQETLRLTMLSDLPREYPPAYLSQPILIEGE